MGFEAVPQVLAFSHDGFLLAAAGHDTLNIWKTLEAGAQPKCVWHIPHGSNELWKSEGPSADANAVTNGTAHDEEEDETEAVGDQFTHKLGWDADGKRIAFGMNGQVAVIRL